MADPTLRDPRTLYPRPPFDTSEQKSPGLEQQMTPKPDCGETSYKGSGKLAGRKALITGGDSGIGRAVAIAFAREGADVAIGYLKSEEPDAKEVVKLIEAERRKAVPLPGDISDEKFCKTLIADAVKGLGGLDILVNNAADMGSRPSLGEITTEQFDQTMKTNLYALLWITQAALEHLPPGASVINTASIQAYDPSAGIIDYAMTKAGIVAFTKGATKPLMEKGIRINAVAPGPFWTPIQPSGQPPKQTAKVGSGVAFGRPGQPVELAPIYVLLASNDGSYVTGEVYGATGGEGVA